METTDVTVTTAHGKRLDFSNIEYQLRRAKEHLAELEDEIGDIVDSNHDIRTADGDIWEGEGPSTMYGEVEFTEEAPQPIRGKVGEFAIGLRSALNYMTVRLATLDSAPNVVGNMVQFPIDDRPDSFALHRDNFLRGISHQHVAFFERYQPYNGCDWMKRLRELSNTCKHLDLVRVKTEYSRLHGTAWENADDEAEGSIDPREVYVEEITVELLFADRVPVLDALHHIQKQVLEVFAEFKTLFVS